MAIHFTPQKPFLSASTPASFEAEQRDLLDGRCKLVFLLGFLISLTVHFFYSYVVELSPAAETSFTPWTEATYDLFAVSTGIAAALLFARRWNTRQLLIIDYAAISFCVLLSHFVAVVFDVAEVPAFAIALILFIHAAFIPVPIASQMGLALTAVVGFPLLGAVAYSLIPGIESYWAANGGSEAFRVFLLEGTFQVAILATVSVLITKALYNMRKSLHKAQRLGNYVIKGELGKGGMGRVLIAEHALICRPTAVKVLEAPAGEGEASLARFEREVRLSAALTHPNTITIFDFGRGGDNTFYYAMEYLNGLDLESLVRRFGPLPPERAVFILTQICGSLAEAHRNEIVHRDVKPANIFLTNRGGLYDFVKVLDFGLAKEVSADDTAGITKTGMLFGTPKYLSPETVEESALVDGRSDLYCLGGVAYWMLAGHPPFQGNSCVQVILDHVRKVPKRPSEVSEIQIPGDLDDIVMKCLEKKPADRFQAAGELDVALRSVRFDDPWTWEKASEWWQLHVPEASDSGAEVYGSGLAAEPKLLSDDLG
jgi:serine/threonine-protein kinase